MTIQYELMQAHDCEEVAILLQKSAQSQGGGLLGEFPLIKVKSMFANSDAVIVARERNHVIGVVFSFQANDTTLPPLLQYITLNFHQEMQNNWFYGPVCIDAVYRGKNILPALYNTICKQHTGKPVAFINNDNLRSLKAHQRLGMQQVAQFVFEGTNYFLVIGQ